MAVTRVFFLRISHNFSYGFESVYINAMLRMQVEQLCYQAEYPPGPTAGTSGYHNNGGYSVNCDVE